MRENPSASSAPYVGPSGWLGVRLLTRRGRDQRHRRGRLPQGRPRAGGPPRRRLTWFVRVANRHGRTPGCAGRSATASRAPGSERRRAEAPGLTWGLRLGGRTRTPNDWTRTSSVADYTTPEGGRHPTRRSRPIARRLPRVPALRWWSPAVLDLVVDVDQAVEESDDTAERHRGRLFRVVAEATAPAAGRHRRVQSEVAGDGLDPQGVVAVGHQHHPGHVPVPQDAGGGGERLHELAPWFSRRMSASGTPSAISHSAPAVASVQRSPACAAGHDDAPATPASYRSAALPTALQRRRRPAVVLRRAQHDDGVGRGVLSRLLANHTCTKVSTR